MATTEITVRQMTERGAAAEWAYEVTIPGIAPMIRESKAAAEKLADAHGKMRGLPVRWL